MANILAFVSPPNGQYVPAFNQGGLPTQCLVCAGLQSERSSHLMAGMCRPSIREVSLSNGQYVPAINQGGLPPNDRYAPAINQGSPPAQWPVCAGL
jgi:hypothetical protein